jgi:hypothetical protein
METTMDIQQLIEQKMISRIAQIKRRYKEQAIEIANYTFSFGEKQLIDSDTSSPEKEGVLEERERRAGMLQEHWLGKWRAGKSADWSKLNKRYLEHIKNAITSYNQACIAERERYPKDGEMHKMYNDRVFTENEMRAVLEYLQKDFEAHTVIISPKLVSKKVAKSNLSWFSESSSPDFLQGSNWVFYERIGKEPANKQGWGITIGKISFGESQGHFLPVNFLRENNDQVIIEYEGMATKDERHVYLDLFQKGKSLRVNMVLRIYDAPDKQEMFLGHFTFFSTVYNRLLSKVVILTKLQGIDSNIQIGRINYGSEDYKLLDDYIQAFLYSRHLNRMSTPQRNIGNLNILKMFLDEFQGKNTNKLLMDYFQGKYYLYYQRSDYKMTVDEFEIKFSQESNSLEVEYFHKPKDNTYKWYGKPYLNKERRCIILELSNNYPKDLEALDTENPILVTFQIPSEESTTWTAADSFPGIIAGLEDTTDRQTVHGGIALICLVVRGNRVDGNDERLQKFFNHQKSRGSSIKPNSEFIKFRLDEF